MEKLVRKRDDTQRRVRAFDKTEPAHGRPAPVEREAPARSRTAQHGSAEQRRIVLIVDDLERWTTELANVDDEWAFRKVLQTEPMIVLVGLTDHWSADRDPGRALYHGLEIRLAPPRSALTPAEPCVLYPVPSSRRGRGGKSKPRAEVRRPPPSAFLYMGAPPRSALTRAAPWRCATG